MLYIFYGSDRDKARAALNKALEKEMQHADVLRISDAHSLADMQAALAGPGMFGLAGGKVRVTVFDSILGGANEEMREGLLSALKYLKEEKGHFYMLEGGLDAATRKQVEKHAEKSEKFDAPKKERDNSIFALANALQRGDKKALWVGLMREFAKGSAPEAVHGLLFWGAKQMLLKAREGAEHLRAQSLVSDLAKLPHEARRRGEDFEYALERFVLSLAPARA